MHLEEKQEFRRTHFKENDRDLNRRPNTSIPSSVIHNNKYGLTMQWNIIQP